MSGFINKTIAYIFWGGYSTGSPRLDIIPKKELAPPGYLSQSFRGYSDYYQALAEASQSDRVTIIAKYTTQGLYRVFECNYFQYPLPNKQWMECNRNSEVIGFVRELLIGIEIKFIKLFSPKHQKNNNSLLNYNKPLDWNKRKQFSGDDETFDKAIDFWGFSFDQVFIMPRNTGVFGYSYNPQDTYHCISWEEGINFDPEIKTNRPSSGIADTFLVQTYYEIKRANIGLFKWSYTSEELVKMRDVTDTISAYYCWGVGQSKLQLTQQVVNTIEQSNLIDVKFHDRQRFINEIKAIIPSLSQDHLIIIVALSTFRTSVSVPKNRQDSGPRPYIAFRLTPEFNYSPSERSYLKTILHEASHASDFKRYFECFDKWRTNTTSGDFTSWLIQIYNRRTPISGEIVSIESFWVLASLYQPAFNSMLTPKGELCYGQIKAELQGFTSLYHHTDSQDMIIFLNSLDVIDLYWVKDTRDITAVGLSREFELLLKEFNSNVINRLINYYNVLDPVRKGALKTKIISRTSQNRGFYSSLEQTKKFV